MGDPEVLQLEKARIPLDFKMNDIQVELHGSLELNPGIPAKTAMSKRARRYMGVMDTQHSTVIPLEAIRVSKICVDGSMEVLCLSRCLVSILCLLFDEWSFCDLLSFAFTLSLDIPFFVMIGQLQLR